VAQLSTLGGYAVMKRKIIIFVQVLTVVLAVMVAVIALVSSFTVLKSYLPFYGMFQPHTYNWGTGMPFLCDETNACIFRQAHQRWPTNYVEFARFMKQSTSCRPFDRVDFITKPDGNLEYVSYCFSSRITNRMTVKAPDKP
jgi:hypothetical protein